MTLLEFVVQAGSFTIGAGFLANERISMADNESEV